MRIPAFYALWIWTDCLFLSSSDGNQVRLCALHGGTQIPLTDDVVAVKDAAGFVTAHRHGDRSGTPARIRISAVMEYEASDGDRCFRATLPGHGARFGILKLARQGGLA